MRQETLNSVPGPKEWEIVFGEDSRALNDRILELHQRGLTYGQIGEAVGMNPAAVGQRVRRMRR